MNERRLNFVDMAKGIAILLVVLYHLSPQGVLSSSFLKVSLNTLPLFFFFSGYFYRPGKRSLAESLKSRAKSLLVPFFKYSLLFWLAGTIYLTATGRAPFTETLYCLRNFYGGCIWNRVIQNWFHWEYYSLGQRYPFLADFWFLIALFFASLLFFPIADAVLHSNRKTLLAAAALLALTGVLRDFGVYLPYNLQLVPFWSAVMLLGAFAGKVELFRIKGLSGAAEWIAAIAALGAGCVVPLLSPLNIDIYRGAFAGNEVVSMLLFFASSMLVTWGLSEVCKLVELSGIRVKELAWVGTHSMTIYIWHVFIARLISVVTGYSLSSPLEGSKPGLLQSLVFSCVVLAVCAVIDVVKQKLLSRRSK